MSEDLKDILSHLNPEVDQQTLLQYLQGKLTAQQQHEVEKQLMDSDFDADALEGLQNFKDKKNISFLVDQLNSDLKKRTEKKKRLRQKFKMRFEPTLILAVIILLLLIVISYLIIHKSMQ